MRRLRNWIPGAYTTGPVAVFAALFFAYLGLKGGAMSLFDIQSLTTNVLPLAFVALAQYCVILTNGIDLSLGPVMSVAGALTATLLIRDPILALVVAVMAGGALGAGNGALVALFEIPPIIVTLATLSVAQGIALLILPNPGGQVPPDLQAAVTGNVGPVPVALLILVAAGLLVSAIMHTPFGLYLHAIGGDEAAAATSGVTTSRVKLGAYVLAGMLASLGGIYLTIATSSGSPTIGNEFILTSIAAVVLGGVPLIGGRGTVIGVVMGALILTIIGSLLYFANLSSFYQSLFNGIILIVVVSLGTIRGWVTVRARA
jgi:ribose transport system permease protein